MTIEERLTILEKEVADIKRQPENRPEKVQIKVEYSSKNDKIIFPDLN